MRYFYVRATEYCWQAVEAEWPVGSWVRSAALTVVVGKPLPKLAYSGTKGVIMEHESFLGTEPCKILVYPSFFCIILNSSNFYMPQIFFPPHKIAIKSISLCSVKENKLWFKGKLS